MTLACRDDAPSMSWHEPSALNECPSLSINEQSEPCNREKLNLEAGAAEPKIDARIGLVRHALAPVRDPDAFCIR